MSFVLESKKIFKMACIYVYYLSNDPCNKYFHINCNIISSEKRDGELSVSKRHSFTISGDLIQYNIKTQVDETQRIGGKPNRA